MKHRDRIPLLFLLFLLLCILTVALFRLLPARTNGAQFGGYRTIGALELKNDFLRARLPPELNAALVLVSPNIEVF